MSALWACLLLATAARAEEPADEQDTEASEKEDKGEDPMNGIGIGVKVGLGVVAAQKLTSASVGTMGTETLRVRQKQTDTGLALAVPLYLGDGHGFAVTLEFFHWSIREEQQATGEKATVKYTGGQFAMGGSWQLANPLYLFVGIGPRAGAVYGGETSRGAHLAGRLPITFTYYPASMLGLVADFGLGYGGTARVQAPASGDDPMASTTWVSGFLFDLTLGLRFP